jgi:hypothetical protein
LTPRKEFSPDYIDRELDRLDSVLVNHLTVYVAGGYVMARLGLKPATKDIDVILEDERQFESLVGALKDARYRELTPRMLAKPYLNLSASAVLENADGFRWDVFERVVANKLALTGTMRSRAKPGYRNTRLTLLLLSKEDIFLMKSVTERDRDLEDMFLLGRTGLDYNAVFEECTVQSELTDSVWESGLYDRCEELDSRYGLKVPFMRKLRMIADEKHVTRALMNLIREGHDSENALIEASKDKLKPSDIKFGLDALLKKGAIKVTKRGRIAIRPVRAERGSGAKDAVQKK